MESSESGAAFPLDTSHYHIGKRFLLRLFLFLTSTFTEVIRVVKSYGEWNGDERKFEVVEKEEEEEEEEGEV